MSDICHGILGIVRVFRAKVKGTEDGYWKSLPLKTAKGEAAPLVMVQSGERVGGQPPSKPDARIDLSGIGPARRFPAKPARSGRKQRYRALTCAVGLRCLA